MSGDYEYEDDVTYDEDKSYANQPDVKAKVEDPAVEVSQTAPEKPKSKRPYPLYYVFFSQPDIVCSSKREMNKLIGKNMRKVKIIVRGNKTEFRFKKVLDLK